ncbi:MAG TPA: hypothetical protein VN256_27155 [Pyrinomonadaceae bacterium]|nr:hypothetical protein [Pyrinomonadaceae bacterium]
MGCSRCETSPRVKAVRGRLLDYELGRPHFVVGLLKRAEGRGPAGVPPATLPGPLEYGSRREFARPDARRPPADS